MADYQKMYSLLCRAVNDAIDPLEQIAPARPYALLLRDALLQAEDIYIRTADSAPPEPSGGLDKAGRGADN